MRLTFAVSLIGIALLFATLWKYELTAKNARIQVRRAAPRAARRRRGEAARKERRAVMSLLAVAPALPLHSAGKYVAAAYIVFVVLILVYVAIMAIRLGRTERDLAQLQARRPGAQPRSRVRAGARHGDGRVSELLAVGISHKTAPVEVRERLALPDARAADFVRDLRGAADVQEAVAISTCNRTELYLVVGDPVEAESRVLSMLSSQAGIRPTELAGAIYAHRNCDAARHLYRVTAGLESMVVGEAEIQGQVKRAYDTALERDSAGPLINHLFKAALRAGKRVRTETAIAERQLSLPAVAVALARELLGSRLDGRSVVIVGTGETSELTARALADSGGQAGVRREPPAQPRDQPRQALRRREPQLRRAAAGARASRHRRGSDRLAAPPARGA